MGEGGAAGAPRSPAKGKGRAATNGDILAMDLVSAEEGTAADGGGGGAFMQMQLVEQQVRHQSYTPPAALVYVHY